ncbi:hypothetical protein, partial [Enterobacter intestinihominis]
VQLAAPVVEPRSGGCHPPPHRQKPKKKTPFSLLRFLKNWGLGGFENPQNFPIKKISVLKKSSFPLYNPLLI